jgi:hypothetical protein
MSPGVAVREMKSAPEARSSKELEAKRAQERSRKPSALAGRIFCANATKDEKASGSLNLRRRGAQFITPSGANYLVGAAGEWRRTDKAKGKAVNRKKRAKRKAAQIVRAAGV